MLRTGLKNVLLPTLLTVVNNNVTPTHAQQYCFILLTTVNNVGSETLFNPVTQQEFLAV